MTSATSRYIFVSFKRYGHPKKCTQKSSCNTFFIYISHKNWMKCSLQILKNKNRLKRHKYPSPNVLKSNIFGPSATTIRGFWVSLIYPILNFKKMVCPKNVWMWHWWPNINNCACQCFSCCHNFCSTNLSGMVTDFMSWILKLSNIPPLLQHYKKYLTESHPAHRIFEHSWQFLGTKIMAAWEILASTVVYIKS